MAENTPRWSADQVLALAPDPGSQKAGRALGIAGPWRETGHADHPPCVWGSCQGSGSTPYQVCVDLTGPAFKCSCPSRKIPCKHVIGLLLLWSSGEVPPNVAPAWVTEWIESRTERRQRPEARGEGRPRKAADPATSAATQARRASRVEAGVAELERWLTDQVREGLAAASRAGYAHWDTMAARLVDAQAPGLAGAVRRLAPVAGTPDRLLLELGLIWLLVRAYGRADDLPPELAATVRGRIGFPVSTEDVLAGPRVRDEWVVTGLRDELDDRLSIRRVWLRGLSGQPALVLSFAAPGQSLVYDLIPGTVIDAELCFWPGRLPMRAMVAERFGEPRPLTGPVGVATVGEALDEYARALAAEPWLERWPVVVRDATLTSDGARGWHLVDADGAALPLDPRGGDPWRLVAAAGGAPACVAGEWSVWGLRPLSVWVDDRLVRA